MRLARLLVASLLLGSGACSSPTDAPAPSPTPASAPVAAPATAAGSPPDHAARARELADRLVILDGHVDVPYRLLASRDPGGALTEDVTQRTPKGDFDFVRAREGGLDAPFMSIYVPVKHQKDGSAKKAADELIDLVEGIVAKAPDRAAIARTPAEVRSLAAAGRLALPLGMENGAPLLGDLGNVGHFWRRGIRYITLAHSKHNDLSDSATDDAVHGGLSPLGEQVVAEMNRWGIMVDISHLSDAAALEVLRLSQVPVIASHSSLRHFTPEFPRNMSDEVLEALAAKGGVIQINFGSSFLDEEVRKKRSEDWKAVQAQLDAEGLEFGEPRAKQIIDAHEASHPSAHAPIERVADHIDYVVRTVGIDHVGLGSDFDGVGDSLPLGLEDVSKYPNLLRVLLERGYSEADLEKICSGNVLRVWQAVEDHAASRRGAAPPGGGPSPSP
jgi:membrane dipeptidase